MSNNVEVNIKISDLEYVRFEFWFDDRSMTLYLDRMVLLNRETTRHKLKVDFLNSYSRIDSRDFGIKEEPDVPIEVQTEALRLFREKIKVARWEDR